MRRDLPAPRADPELALEHAETAELSQADQDAIRTYAASGSDIWDRDRLVTVNVAKVAEIPEGTRRQSRSMTTAQARRLLASDLDTWWRAYFTLALNCALRPGELTGLRWEEVDLTPG